MSDSLGVSAGKKYYPMRECGFDDIGELLNITAAQAAALSQVRAWSGKDPDGNLKIVWEAVFNDTGSAFSPTVYQNMDIGSSILVIDSGTVRKVWKVAKSATAVVGDWYYEELTVTS